MRKVILISILIICFQAISFSQDKTEDIKSLLTIINSKNSDVEETINNMVLILKNDATDKIQGEGLNKKFNEYIEFLDIESKELIYNIQKKEMVAIYDLHYTHDEIKDLIIFYKSSTGQKFLENSTQISKEIMSVLLTNYLKEFGQKIKLRFDEIEKK